MTATARMTNACQQAAHRYLDLGWSALALCPPDHAGMGDWHKCDSPGKRPWHRWKEPSKANGEKNLQEVPLSHEELDDLFRQQPLSNVGIALGLVSGLVRVDIDGPGGEKLLQEMSDGEVPATLEFTGGRPNASRGLLYRIPDGVKLRTTSETPEKGEELRFQAKGALTVLPPSRHPSGAVYAWKPGHGPDDIEPAPMPAWLVAQMMAHAAAPPPNGHHSAPSYGADLDARIRGAIAYLKATPPAISESHGHNAAMWAARCAVYGFNLGADIGFRVLADHWNQDCQPPWSEAELRHKCSEADTVPFDKPRGWLLAEHRSRPAPVNDKATLPRGKVEPAAAAAATNDVHLTDLGNARRVVKEHGADLHYCHPWKQWLVWDGRRWEEDATAEAIRRVKVTQGALYRWTAAKIKELGKVDDDDQTRKQQLAMLMKLLAHCLKWEDTRRLNACLESARSEPGIPVVPKQLDADRYLLNVLNGTVDLRTGKLREHRREDLITKLAPVEFDPDADCPLWKRSVLRWMADDCAMVGYLQRMAGYGLTGDVSEQCLWFFHGAGQNGKSKYLEAKLGVMGEYAMQGVAELLMAKKHKAHPTERADLFGRRVVCTIETDEGKRMAEAFMKQLTGGEKIRARKCFKDFFEFEPTHKIFLASNHKPTIRGTDFAAWRRIKLVPFTVTIPEAEKDPHLGDKLKAEYPGILAWMVRGCQEWLRHGMQEPAKVTAATAEYQAEQDTVAGFIAECCTEQQGARTQLTGLLEAYHEWSGDKWMKSRAFAKHLRAKGFVIEPGHSNRRVAVGLQLLAEPTADGAG